MHLVSLSQKITCVAYTVRRGELCPAAAEDAGLPENGDCQIRVVRGYTYVFFAVFLRKSDVEPF